MEDANIPVYNEKLPKKIINTLENNWPKIYKTINNLFFLIIDFIKDTLSGLWR